MSSLRLASLLLLLLCPAWATAQDAPPSAADPFAPAPEPVPSEPLPSEPAASEPVPSEVPQAPAPEPRTPEAEARPPEARADEPRPARAGSDWEGPRVELAYRVYSLRDDQGGRTANTGCFSGFLPTRKFRGGGGVEAGKRGYEYGAGEGLLSGNLFAGYQHLGDLGRVVPYVVVTGELGVLFGKRFHTPLTRMIRGVGMELGADVNLVRSLYVGLGVGFMIYTIDDLAYDSWGLRLSIGL